MNHMLKKMGPRDLINLQKDIESYGQVDEKDEKFKEVQEKMYFYDMLKKNLQRRK